MISNERICELGSGGCLLGEKRDFSTLLVLTHIHHTASPLVMVTLITHTWLLQTHSLAHVLSYSTTLHMRHDKNDCRKGSIVVTLSKMKLKRT